ncbi:MAG: hypothetical protein J6Y32_06890 [Bacteroidales bacterium]|nr:hypothetical protein [Bacteroidales bacterium]
MKATSFETRQRAEDLTRDAISIWRQSEREDKLEGIENDPVFNLLLTALAHQSNQLDAGIEHLKEEIFEEISSLLVPYGFSGAVPATAAVSLTPESGLRSVTLDTNTNFKLADTEFSFLPLLKSVVLGVEVSTPVRLDGRRWQVSLSFAGPIESLEGWTFAISGKSFRNLSVSLDGHEVELIRPWDLSELPFTEGFSLEAKLYGHSPLYENSMLSMDLFTRQNICLMSVGRCNFDKPLSDVDLIFEFEGIDEGFSLSKTDIIPNVNILVNASIEQVDLDNDHPICRIEENKTLIHLLRPSNDQIFAGKRVYVRRAGTERFNENSLLGLLNNLMNKFDSDFYAFKEYAKSEIDETFSKLRMLTARLQQQLQKQDTPLLKGTYIILKSDEKGNFGSLNLHYLATDAEHCNDALKQSATFSSPMLAPARQITLPMPAFSPIHTHEAMIQTARYQMTTNGRIVTPSDIKVFCRTFLLLRYGIAGEMVRSIRICTKTDENAPVGYVLAVEVSLTENPFITRSFAAQREAVATMMEKMLTVRSSGLYPIKLTINIA